MDKYRKKPVVIEAFRYWVDARPEWFCDKVTTNEIITHETHCEITTLEGVMRGEVGDYIIQGVKGEVYPCKPDIFEATYESVAEQESIEMAEKQDQEPVWTDEQIEAEMRRVGDNMRPYIADACSVAERIRDDLSAKLDEVYGANEYLARENSMLFDRGAARLATLKELQAELATLRSQLAECQQAATALAMLTEESEWESVGMGEIMMCACGDPQCYHAIEFIENDLLVYEDISDKSEGAIVVRLPYRNWRVQRRKESEATDG